MGTIPASMLVNIQPSVLSAGGNAMDMNGLLLTSSTRVPIGTVMSFPTAAAVEAYFGGGSAPALFAGGGLNGSNISMGAGYFGGYTNSTKKPGALLVSQYNLVDVPGYIRGGSGLTLAQVQAIVSGTLTVVVGGVSKTSSALNLSAASSLSNAAALIQAAFTTPGFTVTYDSVAAAFKITGTSSGVANTVEFPTGANAAPLLLTSATGAVLSQGADALLTTTTSAFMNAITAITTNWATFSTDFDPDGGSGNAFKLAFAAWVNGQNNRYAYVGWDTDITPTESVPAAASFGQLLDDNSYSGTSPVWEPSDYNYAAFMMGWAASLDFERKDGRTTLAFRNQAGLVPTVTSQAVAINLGGNPQALGDFGNGYNYYGDFATANDEFQNFQRGTISGPFQWFDSYVNQIWLNNALQQALMTLLTNTNSIPYNAAGRALIEAACADPIIAALNFGAIRTGVALSEQQKAEVNAAAGLDISATLFSQGWYLQVLPGTAQVRQNRTSPPITLWYMDGQSVQAISLASILIQ